jgi:choline dehydrogenase
VILSGGAFNSPQLLKLSGIGPAEELQKFGITPIVNLPGVGKNLQDRYEVGIISEATSDFTFANACRPGQADDPCFAQWFQGQGLYTSIGALNAIIHKSKTAKRSKAPDPDLFIFSAPIPFRGYYHGYSIPVATTRNQFTWAALKGNTLNRGGTVELKSADPRDTPFINFHYFYEGTDKAGNDLNSVIDGIEFIRQINAQLSDVATEVWPGPQVKTREQLAEFVMNDAWGHHASCSNKMGPRTDPMAVVDSKFRVHGTRNLRVVDASVFPRIPGYFILVPIYMISEKASDLILATARS